MAAIFAGLDVGDYETAVCVLDASARVILEERIASDAKVIASLLKPYRRTLGGVGIEAGTTASRLYKDLERRKYPMVCLDPWHAHAALVVQRNKTDRADAKGLALLVSRGLYTKAHVKSNDAQALRFLLAARKALKRRVIELQLTLRSAGKLFGAVVDMRNRRIRGVKWSRYAKHALAIDAAAALIRACSALQTELAVIDLAMEKMAKADPVCRRLMTMPGVGPITALTFKAAVDDPSRFKSSRTVAAYFGLTPRRHQSGIIDIGGHISRRGDGTVRETLYVAASTMLNVTKKETRLRTWGLALKERRGFKFAAVACARRMAVIMHRMWVTETDFDPAR